MVKIHEREKLTLSHYLLPLLVTEVVCTHTVTENLPLYHPYTASKNTKKREKKSILVFI